MGKWRKSRRSERSASQEHFLDLCELLHRPKPGAVDPKGLSFTTERRVKKEGGEAQVRRCLEEGPGQDSPHRNSLSGQAEETHRETLSLALPTSQAEDPDLAFIMGMWDRLADECKQRLVEVIRENLPT